MLFGTHGMQCVEQGTTMQGICCEAGAFAMGRAAQTFCCVPDTKTVTLSAVHLWPCCCHYFRPFGPG